MKGIVGAAAVFLSATLLPGAADAAGCIKEHSSAAPPGTSLDVVRSTLSQAG